MSRRINLQLRGPSHSTVVALNTAVLASWKLVLAEMSTNLWSLQTGCHCGVVLDCIRSCLSNVRWRGTMNICRYLWPLERIRTWASALGGQALCATTKSQCGVGDALTVANLLACGTPRESPWRLHTTHFSKIVWLCACHVRLQGACSSSLWLCAAISAAPNAGCNCCWIPCHVWLEAFVHARGMYKLPVAIFLGTTPFIKWHERQCTDRVPLTKLSVPRGMYK